MRYPLFISLLLAGVLAFGQGKKAVFESKHIKAEYHLRNGLWDGKYVSHHPNGNKKAEGQFKDNQRVGTWHAWDSTGKLHAEHTYMFDSLPRNADGYFNYTFLKQSDVAIEKRIWRSIDKANNELLFIDPFLFDTLYKEIQQDSLVVFMDEEFQNPRSKNDIKSNFGKVQYEIIGYKLKEDWFIDKKTHEREIRPLGIYPILRPVNSNDYESFGLGWLYFPQLRKILAREKLWDKKAKHITSLDDVFWYRHFTSQIYKELNIYDRPIAAYAKTPDEERREATRIEIEMIEMEHDVWIYGDKLYHFELKTK